MVKYEANNQWRIYNPITKKVHISQDVRFDEGYTYNSQLNEHNEKMGKLWSLEDDEQLALQEKEQEDIIVRSMKETVGDIVAGATTEKNLRDQERVLADDNNESALSSLEDNEPLIPPTPMDPPMTRFFPLEDDSDHTPTPRPMTRKPKGKAPATSPTDRETRSITGSSKPRFRYMNNVAPSH